MHKELILGPPGTGKTTKLINKFEELIDAGAEPHQIAYVSFTKKAVNEVLDRIQQKFDIPINRFSHSRTIHSLAFRELGLRRSDVMQEQHWNELSKLLGISVGNDNWTDGVTEDQIIAFHLNLAHSKCRSYEEHFRAITQSLEDRRFNLGSMGTGGSLNDFVAIGEFIDDYKSENKLLDFNDMLMRGCHLPPLDVRYAIIDEAQDLSPLQWRFCKAMFKSCEKIWIAGDDDQAIYSWAGADLHTFRHMNANRTVLDHSYRLPRQIHKMAIAIVAGIDDRYEKIWGPRDEEGEFHFVDDIDDCPLDNDESWFLLTRTRAQQQSLVHYLRNLGFPYLRNGFHSVKPDHLRVAKTYTSLQRGEQVRVGAVRDMMNYMRNDQYDPSKKGAIERELPDQKLQLSRLQQDFGFVEFNGIWHEFLSIDPADATYYQKVRKRHGAAGLTDTPSISVNTIHGVKGGEADNVYFSTAMGTRPHKNFIEGYTKDDETRIFYVAATRAKKRLYIKPSRQCSFPLPYC